MRVKKGFIFRTGMMAILFASALCITGALAQEAAILPINPVQAQEMKVPPPEGDVMAEHDDEEAENEPGISLFSTVKRGGPVMIPIIFIGILGLTIIIERLIFFTRNRIWSSERLVNFLEEVSKKSTTRYREDREDDLKAAFQQYVNEMERGLAFLTGIGNLAPILGFLGTVTGMINAFSAIAAATTVNARVVAVGIQEALITTAGGLIVAAPVLFFYYLLAHIIQNRFSQAEIIIEQLCGGMPRLTDELAGDSQEGVYNG